MANIAVICEGVSEFNILNHMVSRYSGGHFLNAIQPRIDDVSSVQSSEGGWSRVLAHCNDAVFEHIFQFNDYLIIQIDTDSSHISPYDVSAAYPDGRQKSRKRFHAEVKARLMRDVSREIRKRYLDKIIFAICNNEIECWLLPLYYTDSRRCHTHNCIYLLNLAMSKKGLSGIPDKLKNSPQARKAYRTILKNLKKPQDVVRIAENNPGLKAFLQGLDSIV